MHCCKYIFIVCNHIDAAYGAGISCDSALPASEVTGDLVHDLMSQLATDADGDYLGMAVVDANFENGVWQYSRGNLSEQFAAID